MASSSVSGFHYGPDPDFIHFFSLSPGPDFIKRPGPDCIPFDSRFGFYQASSGPRLDLRIEHGPGPGHA